MAGGSGAKYTTATAEKRWLPVALTSQADSSLEQDIRDASRMIDTWLSNYTTPFPDIAASPATPEHIQTIAAALAAHFTILRLGMLADNYPLAADGMTPQAVWAMGELKNMNNAMQTQGHLADFGTRPKLAYAGEEMVG